VVGFEKQFIPRRGSWLALKSSLFHREGRGWLGQHSELAKHITVSAAAAGKVVVGIRNMGMEAAEKAEHGVPTHVRGPAAPRRWRWLSGLKYRGPSYRVELAAF